MNCEVFPINNSSDGHIVEEVHEQLIGLQVVSGDDFLSESKIFSHVPTFMIPS